MNYLALGIIGAAAIWGAVRTSGDKAAFLWFIALVAALGAAS